ncbi:MAG: acyltransferase [Prevotella sp.]|nr:acyltransferase [Prevotella sp.]
MESGNHNSQFSTLNSQLSEFDEIRPYEPEEMKQAFEDLLNDRQFNVLMKGFAPWLPKGVRNGLLRLAFMGVKTPLDFQKRFMKPIVKYIIRKHTDGCTFDDHLLFTVDGLQFTDDYSAAGEGLASKSTVNCKPSTVNQRFTFVSNHRDIVLDSAFLDMKLVEKDYPTTVEIGIGDNLLIYPWIKRLVRMNKAFTVRRGLSLRETLAASQLMSRYIHFAVTQKKENIWLAQREGRAKDSDDRTQEAVLKMLAMGGDLQELNIVPLTISYEYDPCDYLKAQELQQKRDNPAFKKSRQDDLDNMKTGIFGYKGRVHYHCAAPINTWLEELSDLPKTEYYKAVAGRMDKDIHQGYELFPCNYIALDELHGDAANSAHYTKADKQRFENYLAGQMAKIILDNKDEAFLRERILTMYANPLLNKLAAV